MPLTTVDQGLLGQYAQYTGFKNRIINGAMGIWQRGTSFTVSTTAVTYTADRFGIYQPSGTGTITRDTDVPTGFKYSLKVVGAGTDTIQRIESNNTVDLAGQNVTVSFWFKQTVGAGSGSMTVALQYANSADNFGALTSISSQTITPTSSWAQYSLTFTNMPSGVANGMSIDIYPTSGGSSSTYFITGVQLEKGSTATSFDYRPYGTELQLCQRYYQNAGTVFYGAAEGTTSIQITGMWTQPMRAAPAILVNSGTYCSIRYGGGDVNNGAPTLIAPTSTAFGYWTLVGGFTGLTNNVPVTSRNNVGGTSNQFLSANAEL